MAGTVPDHPDSTFALTLARAQVDYVGTLAGNNHSVDLTEMTFASTANGGLFSPSTGTPGR